MPRRNLITAAGGGAAGAISGATATQAPAAIARTTARRDICARRGIDVVTASNYSIFRRSGRRFGERKCDMPRNLERILAPGHEQVIHYERNAL